MKKIFILNIIFIFGFLGIYLFSVSRQVLAAIDPGCSSSKPLCYTATSVDEWACTGQCEEIRWVCLMGGGVDCSTHSDAWCELYYPGGGCIQTCNKWSTTDPCKINQALAACLDRNRCEATYTLQTCSYSGSECQPGTKTETHGCCGPPPIEEPGPSPTGGGGGPVPTPTSGPGYPTPTPTPSSSPSSVRARVVQVPSLATCPIPAGASPLPAPGVSEVGLSYGSTTVVPKNIGSTYTSFAGLPVGNLFTISAQSVGTYNPTLYCYADNLTGAGGAVSSSSHLLSSAGITWDIGFTDTSQNPWFQSVGGHVRVNGGLSIIPPPNQKIITNLPGNNNAGIVSFGTGQGPAIDSIPSGANKGFMVKETNTDILSYYDYFYSRFPIKDDTTINSATINDYPPAGTIENPTIYLKQGNLTINPGGSEWIIAEDPITHVKKSLVIFVTGSLTIQKNIRVEPGNFLAFIVHGTISVDDSFVGYDFANIPGDYTNWSNANISGIFIAGTNNDANHFGLPWPGAEGFSTGTGISAKHIILHGTFVAYTFQLQRNLGVNNATYPAERFVFRPDLWKNAPNELKEIDLAWQEVAP